MPTPVLESTRYRYDSLPRCQTRVLGGALAGPSAGWAGPRGRSARPRGWSARVFEVGAAAGTRGRGGAAAPPSVILLHFIMCYVLLLLCFFFCASSSVLHTSYLIPHTSFLRPSYLIPLTLIPHTSYIYIYILLHESGDHKPFQHVIPLLTRVSMRPLATRPGGAERGRWNLPNFTRGGSPQYLSGVEEGSKGTRPAKMV